MLMKFISNSCLCYLTGCNSLAELFNPPYNQVSLARLLKALTTQPWEVIRLLQARSQTTPAAILIVLPHGDTVTPSPSLLLKLMQILHNLSECFIFFKQLLDAVTLPRGSPNQPDDTILFVDGLNRETHLCYASMKQFEVFHALLTAEFRNLPGTELVSNGQFRVLYPTNPNLALTSSNWTQFIRPGACKRIEMFLLLSYQTKPLRTRCPRCSSRSVQQLALGRRKW